MSDWSWDAQRQVYTNVQGVTAVPQPDGSWRYQDPAPVEELDGAPLPPPLLRLVVLSSPVLEPTQLVVQLEPGVTVSIGRDKANEPRIRLKELPVSKHHANLFWVKSRGGNEGYWAIADTGSMHGTVLVSLEGRSRRLSDSRTSSKPYELRHGDTLNVGNTAFAVHLHTSFSCATCAILPDSSNLISLDASDNPETVPEYVPIKTKAEKGQDYKSSMKSLKDRYLKPASAGPSSDPTSDQAGAAPAPVPAPYVDRAKARRMNLAVTPASVNPPAASTSSAPVEKANPFAASSRGSLLLAKMGFSSSSTVSAAPNLYATPAADTDSAPPPTRGLGALIQPRVIESSRVSRDARPGLGSAPLVPLLGTAEIERSGNGEKRGWRDDVREQNRKRWKDMN